MSNSNKNVIITPSTDTEDDPTISLRNSNTAARVDVRVDGGGNLLFEGTGGTLFTISASFNGMIHSVNDISGIPYIDTDAVGVTRVAPYAGILSVGQLSVVTGGDRDNDKVQVNGNTYLNGKVSITDDVDISGTLDATGNTARVGFLRVNYTNSATGGVADATDKVQVNGNTYLNGNLGINNLPVFDTEAAASSLDTGAVYQTSTGELRIKL